jgi:hypothetical protein
MLNTSLHNPAVKDKPAVDRFIAMNRGINDGGDLPSELLEVSGVTAVNVTSMKEWQNLVSVLPEIKTAYRGS